MHTQTCFHRSAFLFRHHPPTSDTSSSASSGCTTLLRKQRMSMLSVVRSGMMLPRVRSSPHSRSARPRSPCSAAYREAPGTSIVKRTKQNKWQEGGNWQEEHYVCIGRTSENCNLNLTRLVLASAMSISPQVPTDVRHSVWTLTTLPSTAGH